VAEDIEKKTTHKPTNKTTTPRNSPNVSSAHEDMEKSTLPKNSTKLDFTYCPDIIHRSIVRTQIKYILFYRSTPIIPEQAVATTRTGVEDRSKNESKVIGSKSMPLAHESAKESKAIPR
jgi:hypothetical protein